MAWRSYRSHGHNADADPFGATVAAMFIALVFVAPWLLAAFGIAKVWRWLAG
jgi:hypothetical protein